MNLIHSPLHEATGALAGWMASKAIQVDVEPTSDDARSWVLSHEDGDSLLTHEKQNGLTIALMQAWP